MAETFVGSPTGGPDGPKERRVAPYRQVCRVRHVDHQPSKAEERDVQAIETAVAEKRLREDVQALQGDSPVSLTGRRIGQGTGAWPSQCCGNGWLLFVTQRQ